MAHPSGRPIRERVVKGGSLMRGTLHGFVVSRMNVETPERTDLGSYLGFIVNREADDIEGAMARKRKASAH